MTIQLAGAWTSERRFLAACRREPADATPIWFMRQAGRCLPGYRAMRERHSVLEIATTPELCAEVSLMPVAELDVDAAVMFADIMLPLRPMGVELELTLDGPVIAQPIRTAADVARLRTIEPAEDVGFLLEAIRLVRRELDGRRAVVGIAGGPFTLAGYLIEGGASRDFLRTRTLMHADPATFQRLLALLAEVVASYLIAQADAGAQVLQLFDSWVGAIGPADYAASVAPHVRRIFETLQAARPDVPTIHFAAASGALLGSMAEVGGDVIGVDHRTSLAAAWATIGPDRAIQGNLDAARLLAGWETTRAGADAVLAEAGGRPGHLFNLGHGIAAETDPGILAALVNHVRERSQR